MSLPQKRVILSLPRKLSILGATGSIGTQALDVVRALRSQGEPIAVVALAAGHRVKELATFAQEFGVRFVAVAGPREAEAARHLIPGVEVAFGRKGIETAASHPEADLVLNAVVGAEGLWATLAALTAGKYLALANKESLVVGGELVLGARSRSDQIIPVDSEHAALFQLLAGVRREEVEKVWITASGGAFRDRDPTKLAQVTPAEALAHPTWKMGPRITVDSATLVNKAFEVIEAHYLFSLPWEAIGVLLHPESQVHALVELVDGTILAQLAPPDMRIPIRAAITYPRRLPQKRVILSLPPSSRLLLSGLNLRFAELPEDRYPAFRTVLLAGKAGGTAPAVANAADEVLVTAFLQGQIPFPAIAQGIAEVLTRHTPEPSPDLSSLAEADTWARKEARRFIARAFGGQD